MTDKKSVVIETISYPHSISLYNNPPNPNIYYYFTWKHKSYRGSTLSHILDISRNKSIEIFMDIKSGRKKKGNEKIVKFEDICKSFLKSKKDNQSISNRTLTDYVGQSKYLLERYKGRNITELCSKSIYKDYTDWRRQYYQSHETKRKQRYKRYNQDIEGREYLTVGNVRINREIRLLVSMLRYAKEYMNVLHNLNIPQYTMLPEERRNELLTQKEYLILEEYWMNKNPYYWKIISFLNNTGIRYPSEMNKIVWGDVDLDQSYVLIRDRKNKNMNITLDTAVPLVGSARTIIEELKARENISKGEKDFVFVNDKGIQIKSMNKAFKKSLVECKIEKNKLTMYSLRHLFTTRMIKRADIAPKVLATVLGHRDLTMIDKHYSHLKVEDLVYMFQQSELKKQEILKQRRQDQSEYDITNEED